MTDRTMEALKPCPFCGGEGRIQHNGRAKATYIEVVCDKCEICGPAEETYTAAIAAWNRRAIPPKEGGIAEVEGLIERLRANAVRPSDFDTVCKLLYDAAAELSRLVQLCK